ncbi:MAG: sugar ABC transporter ATP-binding protein [Lachnospiraceae bacterium]|nr:sugar ABC transporter ATP-binding protein [Lachnospiraceae bacterium]
MLSVKGIYKSFGSNAVLKGISMDLKAGEVIALIGGNGAGKSTLMKIIMGIYQPDTGDIYISGEKVNMTKPSVALAKGIYMVPQEPMLFPNMTVEENVLMGFDEKPVELRKRLDAHVKELGWDLNLQRKANSLSIAEQQLVEILRGLMREARILILDEPTSALTFDEVQSLFKVVEDLKKKNISIIYITHRLTEVFEIATHVAIMRDGVVTLNGPVAEFTKEMLVKGLLPPNTVSKEKEEKAYEKVDYEKLKPVLQVKDFSGYGFSNITFDLYPGEILGIAGVVGAGRTELVSTIFGRDKVLGGKVYLDGQDITGLTTKKILDAGINYVPEDRHYHGLFKISSIAANTTSALLDTKTVGKFILNRKKENEIAQQYVDDFRTKIVSLNDDIGSLSGGNQQKVVIARALSTGPKVVILDEPTRGIDAAARGDVYNIIHQLKDTGVAVLLISSDMEEIQELADRSVTVFQGRINGEFSKDEISQDSLTSASFGFTGESEVAE